MPNDFIIEFDIDSTTSELAEVVDISLTPGVTSWSDLNGKPAVIAAGSTIAEARTALNLGNVDNTSDVNKPVSTATQAAITAASTAVANTAQTNLSSAISSLTKSSVGLSNVDNTSDVNKPISTATQAALDAKESASNKGAANGYASLDSGGKVPVSQLPNSVMEYQGVWNATTNTPTLSDSTGRTGDVYRVTVAGTANLGSGSIVFDVGDYVIYNGTVWEKSDTTDAVASVAGKTGNVTLVKSDVGLGNVDNTSDVNKPISTATQTALDAKQPLAANLTSFAAKTAPTGTVVGTSDAQTLTNKDLSTGNTFPSSLVTTSAVSVAATKTLTVNQSLTLIGTTDGATITFPSGASTSVVSTSATQSLLNKTISFGSNTITGTTAQFNTALTDNDFATLAGTETLTNKTLTSPTITTPLGVVPTSYTSTSQIMGDINGTRPVIGSASSLPVNALLIPALHNDMAYATYRGATVSVTVNGVANTTWDSSLQYAFMPRQHNVDISGVLTTDVIVVTVDHSAIATYTGNLFYGIDFRQYTAPPNVTIEAWDNTASSWVTVTSVTNSTAGSFGGYLSNSNSKTKFRITMSGATTHRIMQIYTAMPVKQTSGNITTSGIGSALLPRNGGELFGTSALPPTFTATGSDSNIGINLVPKGTGTVQANGVEVVTTTGVQTLTNKTCSGLLISGNLSVSTIKEISQGRTVLTTASNGGISDNTYVTVASSTNASPTLSAAGVPTDIGINLVPKGAGTIQANGVDVVTTTGTQTLTNKTVSYPKINFINNTNGVAVIGFGTGVSGSGATYIQIDNGSNTNSINPAITAMGATNVSLDLKTTGTGTVKANGVDVVTTTGAQTLTNKTLTSPTISAGTINGEVTIAPVSAANPRAMTMQANTISVFAPSMIPTQAYANIPSSTASPRIGTMSTIIPGFTNDLAYNIERGGSIAITKNGTTLTPGTDYNIYCAFNNGDNNFGRSTIYPRGLEFYGQTSTADVFVITVGIASSLTSSYASTFGCESITGFGAKDVTIEIYDAGLATWVTIYSVTNHTDTPGFHAGSYQAAANSVTQIRYTFTNWATTSAFRIGYLWAQLSGLNNGRFTNGFFTRGGGNLYGTNSAPPRITATGADTNIDLYLATKGTGTVKANGNTILNYTSAPATATSTGVVGQMAIGADNYLYVCTATNTWKRTNSPLATF